MRSLVEILQQNNKSFSPVIPQLKSSLRLMHINFGNDNPELETVNYDNVAQFALFIDTKLKEHHKIIAYGGYLEDREMYRRSKIFKAGTEQRSIHLGVDLWAPENTPVMAPLDAVVHSFAINPAHGDYGGTVILQHQMKGITFYTLYGHLSHQSVYDKSKGQKILAGQNFAWIGEPNENGYWPPHLHFQLITDMLTYEGDFPGVCTPGNRDYYAKLCPDPSAILGLQ